MVWGQPVVLWYFFHHTWDLRFPPCGNCLQLQLPHTPATNQHSSVCSTTSKSQCTCHLFNRFILLRVAECTKWAAKHRTHKKRLWCTDAQALTSSVDCCTVRKRAFLTALSDSCCSVSSSSMSILNSRLSDLSVHPWGKRHMQGITNQAYVIVCKTTYGNAKYCLLCSFLLAMVRYLPSPVPCLAS